MARASEGGGSSYDNVHQMADLKPSTAAPRGGDLTWVSVFEKGESDEDEVEMGESCCGKEPLALVEPKDRTHLTHQSTHGANLKRDGLGRRAGAQEVCVGRGTLLGEDAVSPNSSGLAKALLPRHKLIAFQPLSLGWETLRSSQDKSYWCNVVSGGPAKPRCQHLERSLTLGSDHSDLQACELLGPILLKDLSPQHTQSFPPPPTAAQRHKWVLRFMRPMASTLGLPETPSWTLLQASQLPHTC